MKNQATERATRPSGRDFDAVVIGGGLAGCAAAIRLAQAGRAVALLERAAQPTHKVCGEFLSAEAIDYLRSLGIDLVALRARPIARVRVAGRHSVSGTQLPFAALTLTRRRLDEALLERASAVGVDVRRGKEVRALIQTRSGWRAESGGEPICARFAFLATGKNDLRGFSRSAGPQNDLVAFKMYWKLKEGQASALDQHVEMVLFAGGYAGLALVEDGSANFSCLVGRARLRELGGKWEALITAMLSECPHLAERLSGAQELLDRPIAVSSIPYGWVRASAAGPDLWALGDQATVIPSFTGDGMSIALHSGCLAADHHLRGERAEDFQQELARSLRRQVGLATSFSRMVVQQRWQGPFVSGTRLWPGGLRLLAASTRIPERFRLV